MAIGVPRFGVGRRKPPIAFSETTWPWSVCYGVQSRPMVLRAAWQSVRTRRVVGATANRRRRPAASERPGLVPGDDDLGPGECGRWADRPPTSRDAVPL